MAYRIVLAAIVLLLPVCGFGQLPQSGCDGIDNAFEGCLAATKNPIGGLPSFRGYLRKGFFDDGALSGQRFQSATIGDAAARTSAERDTQNFHWGRALAESFTFLVIEQAYVVHTDFRWVVSENGIPFNHYWRDYTQSLSEWTSSGWDDGDPNWFGYIGHPIQGALTGFIQIQNDPQSEKQEFSKTRAYWKSRLKAALWNTAYSMQWNLGPLSEVTVEKYGTKTRPPWNPNGSFPCTTKNCYTGVGQIDIVMTPLGGTGWLVGEDFLDAKIVRRVESATQNRFLINTVRVALNPLRGGANMLHGKNPWYRATRDAQGMSHFTDQKTTVSTGETPRAQVSQRGNVFLGYSHEGAPPLEVTISGAATACDPLSGKSSKLSGWNVAVEKMYLRYFGVVADFSGQYGGVSQSNFLLGLRGGASIGRFRPFAPGMIGAGGAT